MTLISIERATELVLARAQPTRVYRVPTEEVLGRVLAESVASDVDSPPHDKSLVDGYAVRAADVGHPPVTLQVIEEVVAGDVPSHPVTAGAATQIMTGAPIPDGADAVVMVEDTSRLPGAPARVVVRSSVSAGQSIMPRGKSMQRGHIVVPRGRRLRAVEIGLLAEVGRTEVQVYDRPTVAILPTGDELVPRQETPGPGRIRNSNGPLLTSLAQSAGGDAVELGIARDDAQHLCELARAGLDFDILLLSGGVSAGTRDLVPEVLDQLGVKCVFHKVNLKPGKPLWFGEYRGELRRTLVYGLPGNPVSSLVCFELFVRPMLEAMQGQVVDNTPELHLPLTEETKIRGDRPTFWPSRICGGQSHGLSVMPLPWHGSADLRTLVEANCLAYFPHGNRTYRAGEAVAIHMLGANFP